MPTAWLVLPFIAQTMSPFQSTPARVDRWISRTNEDGEELQRLATTMGPSTTKFSSSYIGETLWWSIKRPFKAAPRPFTRETLLMELLAAEHSDEELDDGELEGSQASLIDSPARPRKNAPPLAPRRLGFGRRFMDVAVAQLSSALVFANSTDATNSTTSTFGSASPIMTDSATPPVASLSAADPSPTPSTFPFSGTVSFASPLAWPTGIIVAPSPSPSSSGAPYVAGASPVPAASKGPIIAATVGGSIAASLLVLAGALFCLRNRLPLRPRTPPAIGAPHRGRRPGSPSGALYRPRARGLHAARTTFAAGGKDRPRGAADDVHEREGRRGAGWKGREGSPADLAGVTSWIGAHG
ncbi:hypothetical protein B0H14DRAFT_3156856 [Mycena olivaceomarginata]|nr:hypothetical protein B0H14DRAFT_3156856 [Mycena olivaceomarginata]